MSAELITRQSLADGVAQQWGRQYNSDQYPDKQIIFRNLKNLGKRPNPDDVDRVIGNTSWTHPPVCRECGEVKDAVLRLGDEPDYDSSTTYICLACLAEVNYKYNS